MSATQDRTYAEVAGRMHAWRSMEAQWAAARVRRTAPYLAIIERYECGDLDRAALADALGVQVERDYLRTMTQRAE